jgi:hypothetical protein
MAMEAQALLDECPIQGWEGWMDGLWQERLPGLLSARLGADSREAIRHVLWAMDAEALHMPGGGWDKVTEVALSRPRQVVATEPLDESEVAAAHMAIRAAVLTALDT